MNEWNSSQPQIRIMNHLYTHLIRKKINTQRVGTSQKFKGEVRFIGFLFPNLYVTMISQVLDSCRFFFRSSRKKHRTSRDVSRWTPKKHIDSNSPDLLAHPWRQWINCFCGRLNNAMPYQHERILCTYIPGTLNNHFLLVVSIGWFQILFF